jgi:hypothetical protein
MARRWLVFTLVMAAAIGGAVWAQDGGGDGNRGGDRNERREGRGEGRGGSPEEWRQRMAERMKEQLQVNDEEWGVLEPKIEKVGRAMRDARGGFGMGRRGGGQGGGGQGGSGGDQPETEVAKATRDLRTTLEAGNASEQDLAAKLTALREARKKAQAELEAARKELQEVLTPRQEAVMVMMGMLE